MALALAVLLTGACGNAEDGEGSKASPPSAVVVSEATAFIRARVEPLSTDNWAYTPEIVSLGPTWQWRGNITRISFTGTFVSFAAEEMLYEVDPAQLSRPVSAVENPSGGFPWVKFECRTNACIRATGKTFSGSGDAMFNADEITTKMTEGTPVSSMNPENVWFVKDMETAQRLAAAMNVLLESQGARERAF